MATWRVYQFRGDSGLLYVGYSRDLRRRLSQHRRKQSWWPEVTSISSEEFATEDEARQREKEVWAAERPKYNRVNPFQTAEEKRAQKRVQSQKWASANREVARKRCRESYARHREARLARQREYSNRPEVRARERERWQQLRGVPRRPKGWPQDGPGLF